MSRQRGLIARSVALVALATTFAVSTAAFNTTYQQQALADARLSNGADVVVTTARSAQLAPSFTTTLAQIPGVGSVEPLQHRYAYIGKDLQDLFGVNARTVASAHEAPGRLVHRRQREDAPRPPPAHAERRPAERGGRPRLPAAAGRHARDAAPRPQDERPDQREVPLHRDHERVPDGAQGRVHHRERVVRHEGDGRSGDRLVPDPDAGRVARRRREARRCRGRHRRHRDRHRQQPDADRGQPHERRARGPDARRARLRARAGRRRDRPPALARDRRAPPDVRDRLRARREAPTARRVHLDRDGVRDDRRPAAGRCGLELAQLDARQAADRRLRSTHRAGYPVGLPRAARRGDGRRRGHGRRERCAGCGGPRSRPCAI